MEGLVCILQRLVYLCFACSYAVLVSTKGWLLVQVEDTDDCHACVYHLVEYSKLLVGLELVSDLWNLRLEFPLHAANSPSGSKKKGNCRDTSQRILFILIKQNESDGSLRSDCSLL